MLTVALALCLAQAPLAPNTPLPPGHPPLGPGTSPQPSGSMSSDELLKRLDAAGDQKGKEKTFEVAASLGKLYYGHARYAEAISMLQEAVLKAEPARTFYLGKLKGLKGKPVPAPAAAGCPPGPDATLDTLFAKAQAQKDPAAAAACARAALHPLIEIEAQLAGSKFLSGDTAGALAVYDRALQLFESNPDARYGRGAARLDAGGEDLVQLKAAKADFERFLAENPSSPRAKQAKSFLSRVNAAIAAGGVSKVSPAPPPQHQPPQLTPELIEAVKNVERTPELIAGFQKLIEDAEEHLARARFQDALNNYKQVMPYQPENGRLKAGMAWALVKLDRQPMADTVWRVASQSPEALDALGEVLKKKGEPEQARALWKKLAETVPPYAGKLTGKL